MAGRGAARTVYRNPQGGTPAPSRMASLGTLGTLGAQWPDLGACRVIPPSECLSSAFSQAGKLRRRSPVVAMAADGRAGGLVPGGGRLEAVSLAGALQVPAR